MYLTKLYRYNKWLFAAILFFVIMQLLVTYKRGMVISPWYNYGMYSEKIYPQKVYEVNNSLTGPAWLYLLSPQRDDEINVTLDNYRHLAKNDSLYENEITRLFAKVHLPVPSKKYCESRISETMFRNWFARYSGLPDSTVAVDMEGISYPQRANWDGKELKLQNRSFLDENGNIRLF